jgi:2'-5' RNA ligase
VREPTRRLFFALWPDDTQRAAFAHATRKAVRSCGGRPVPEQSLHVTLAFLGSVPERRVPELHTIARQVAQAAAAHGSPLLVSFDRLAYWPKAKVLCALGEAADDREAVSGAHATGPTDAPALTESLKSETVAAGFAPDLKPFRAHVTVARKVARVPGTFDMRKVLWSFDAFALVESRTLPEGPVYSVVQSYVLGSAEKVRA